VEARSIFYVIFLSHRTLFFLLSSLASPCRHDPQGVALLLLSKLSLPSLHLFIGMDGGRCGTQLCYCSSRAEHEGWPVHRMEVGAYGSAKVGAYSSGLVHLNETT
jgi:hypothetical protein